MADSTPGQRETGLILGVAGLNAKGADAAELHYWIRTDRAGKGLTCRCRIAHEMTDMVEKDLVASRELTVHGVLHDIFLRGSFA